MADSQSLTYPTSADVRDGAFTPLASRLVTLTAATALDLREGKRPWRVALWFRRGARRIFYLQAVRKAGRLVIEVGGVDRRVVREAVRICRVHFDRLFGASAENYPRNPKS